METGGVFCKCSKTAVLKLQPAERQSRLTICQSLPWRGAAQVLPQTVGAVLLCLHTKLISLQMDDSAPDPAKTHEISFAELYF